MALNFYRGTVQSERPVNATRVKDVLYIFNGTYPMYYKGDGKLYLFPEHQTTYNELQVGSHNTMMNNFEQSYYRPKSALNLKAFSSLNEDDFLAVNSFDFTPKLPFTQETNSGSDFNIKTSFSIPEDKFLFNSLSANNNKLKATAYYRASVPGSTEASYVEVPTQNFKFFLAGFSLGRELTLHTGIRANIANIYFEGGLKGIPIGLRDILFEFEIVSPAGESFDPKYIAQIEFPEITFSIAKIEDYPTEEFPDRGDFKLRAPWSCNNVIEHYGQLLIWGSTGMPNTLFISENRNLNYFPSNYTFTFQSDENEPINSIVPYMNILVIQSDSKTWGLKGNNPVRFLDAFAEITNPNIYTPFSINSSLGSIAPRSVRPIRNRLYFLSQEGLMELTSLFATDDRYNVRPVDRNIINLIPQDRSAVGIQFDNQYWINFPETGELFRYYIDKEAWVKDTFNFKEFNGIYRFYNRDGKLHFITHPLLLDAADVNYRIIEGKVVDSLATDFGKPIQTKFNTSKMNQQYPFHSKKYQELKLDFSVQNEYIAVTKIEAVGDTDVPYTITADFKAYHTYAVSVNTNAALSDVVVQGAVSATSAPGLIYFTIGSDDVSEVTIQASGLTVGMFSGFVVTDETYDKNLAFNVNIVSDNNSLIRGVDIVDSYYGNVLDLISNELGIMSNVFEETFQNSQFGKSYKFVHTNKLYGNGYDINLYYEDSSKVKWTLETIGVTHKMRRTRSR